MKNRKKVLKRKIEGYLKKKQISRYDEHKKLEKPFLAKARKNFTVGKLLYRISEQEASKR